MRLFAAACTQWRIGGMAGVPTGLDYPAVYLVGRAIGIPLRKVIEKLQVIEDEALRALRDRLRDR